MLCALDTHTHTHTRARRQSAADEMTSLTLRRRRVSLSEHRKLCAHVRRGSDGGGGGGGENTKLIAETRPRPPHARRTRHDESAFAYHPAVEIHAESDFLHTHTKHFVRPRCKRLKNVKTAFSSTLRYSPNRLRTVKIIQCLRTVSRYFFFFF